MSTPSRYVSPLRYPGGKAKMGPYLADLMAHQFTLLDVEIWAEPFAGGLGAGLHALVTGAACELWFCEANPAIAAMWAAIIDDAHGFASRVETLTPSLDLFYAARDTVTAALTTPALATTDRDHVALAAFIVNRCSRSGMVAANVGPIGGKTQAGAHTVASRFHPDRLGQRIRALAPWTRAMRLRGDDGIKMVEGLDGSVGIEDEIFVFVDPPYVDVGNTLYANGMDAAAHRRLAAALNTCQAPWVLTYDSTPLIANDWYQHRRVLEYTIRHGAGRAHLDTEYLIAADHTGINPDLTPLPGLSARWIRWDDGFPTQPEQYQLGI